MKMRNGGWVSNLSRLFTLILSLLIPCSVLAQNETPRKAAIFVENRGGAALSDQVPVFEDLITSRIADKGFVVISRETSIGALKKGTRLDELLESNTSALRLAQSLGADYLIVVSITSFGSEKRTFKDENLNTVNLIETLRVSYKILEGAQGGALAGAPIKVSKTTRSTANNQTESSDTINELLDEAAAKIADSMGTKQSIVRQKVVPADWVEISVACGMQDLAQLPISIPDIFISDDKVVTISERRLEIQPLDVTVELNGTALGSAPGKFKVPPGLNKIRLTREGFADWERTINTYDGQVLKVALQMSEAGYARWKDNTAFLQKLENNRKLTDGTVKVLEGFAQTLRQSGYKVDVKHDSLVRHESKGDALIKPQISIFK
ncbi:MAG: PEGA domain-containing protein [Verrucomicrobia bacterium]|nr:PEGA domain-containing protein [Verrucomicrobiota bacterium]